MKDQQNWNVCILKKKKKRVNGIESSQRFSENRVGKIATELNCIRIQSDKENMKILKESKQDSAHNIQL